MNAVTQMRIYIPAATHRLLKAKAAKSGKSLKRLVAEVTAAAVADDQPQTQPERTSDAPTDPSACRS